MSPLSAELPAVDQLIRSRRRTLSLQVLPDARVVVRAPRRASIEQIMNFVGGAETWIRKKQQQARDRHQTVSAKRFVDGEKFLLFGNWRKLRVDLVAEQPFTHINDEFVLAAPKIERALVIFRSFYRHQAEKIISDRLRDWLLKMNVSYRKLRITSARTRWGSCSARGTLSFSWRLAMAPEWVIDYVIVHELSHLEHANHSKRFWEKVSQWFPNHADAKRWLIDHHHLMILPGEA